MSESANVQLIKEMYATIGRSDMAGLKNMLGEDIDWLSVGSPTDFPLAGQKSSPQQVVDYFVLAEQLVEVLEFTQHEFIAMGNTVVVLGSEKVRIKATGKGWETEWVHIYTITNGKITRQREFFDTAAIAMAFRPS